MPITFCPHCSRKLSRTTQERRERFVCDAEVGGCGFIDFGRFTVGVGGVVVEQSGKEPRLLLIQRNQEPNKGGWTIPGGYVEADETAEAAVVREVEEETGIRCMVVGLVGFRNRADPEVNTSYVIFLLEKIGGALISAPNDEIAQAGFYTLSEIEKIERVTPLSRTLAEAAIAGELKVLAPVALPHSNKVPSSTLFIG